MKEATLRQTIEFRLADEREAHARSSAKLAEIEATIALIPAAGHDRALTLLALERNALRDLATDALVKVAALEAALAALPPEAP
jgi:hypothetical protein